MPHNPNQSSSHLKRSAWSALAAHRRTWHSPLRELFTANPQRFQQFSTPACGLLLDFSKNPLTTETLDLLVKLAEAHEIPGRLRDLFDGKAVNVSEKRPAWHTALRAGKSAPHPVQQSLAVMHEITQVLRAGAMLGSTGSPITDVVSLGIGGSAIGPQLVAAACTPHSHGTATPRVHFVSNPSETFTQLISQLDAAGTLFIVQSKSFKTQETLHNARCARHWLQTALHRTQVDAHFIAITAQTDAAVAFGIPRSQVLPLWNWVGGRYSLWSATGLPARIAMGNTQHDLLLAGAAAMDAHTHDMPLAQNMPVLLALIDIWEHLFWDIQSRAVVPYPHELSLLPAHLQQLSMESLGKGVRSNGKILRTHSGPLLWGGLGSESQHSYFQWLHQGTHTAAVDFIACCEPTSPSDPTAYQAHTVMLANCFAQSALLMNGLTTNEVTAQLIAKGLSARTAERQAPHQTHPGNRPSNTILLPRLDAYSVGALIALYEHRTYILGVLLGVNAFDQWGVEHGKHLAKALETEFNSPSPENHFDSSTQGLIAHVRALQAALSTPTEHT